MRKKLFSAGLILAALLAVSGVVLSQAVRSNLTLVVSGQPGQAEVIEKDGRSYVDVEALARLTNGSLSFKGNQIMLTLPALGSSSPAETPGASPAASSAFSSDFLKAGAEAVAVIREWRGALADAIQNGYPVTDESVSKYKAQATKSLHLVFVAVSTDADRNAFQLVRNEFDNMQKLNNKILEAHRNMQNISPDTLKNDPLNQQVMSCAHSLVSMAASGEFQDDGSCR